MAKSKIPSPLERRHLIEKEMDEKKSLALAETYLEDGRVLEAIDFLSKSGASDRLNELRQEAVTAGDAFLLRSLCRALEVEASLDEWQALAQAATSLGKERYASDAQRQAERLER